MAYPKKSKDEILAIALELFRRQGYHKTSMEEIGKACELLKGSLYHYFSSKESLAQEVLSIVQHHFDQYIFAQAYTPHLSSSDRMQRMLKATEDYFLSRHGGCIMGNLALEVIDVLPSLAEKIAHFFDCWQKAFFELYQSQYDSQKAQDLAEQAVAETQGALMMMRIKNSPTPLLQAHNRIKNLISY